MGNNQESFLFESSIKRMPLSPTDPAYGWQLPAVAPQVSLAGGVLRFDAPACTTEVVEPGFKLVLVLGGQLRYQLRERQAVRVQGPAFHLSLNREPFTVRHEFDPAAALEYVAVRMPAAGTRSKGSVVGRMAHEIGCSELQPLGRARNRLPMNHRQAA